MHRPISKLSQEYNKVVVKNTDTLRRPVRTVLRLHYIKGKQLLPVIGKEIPKIRSKKACIAYPVVVLFS
jgi:hypothetical protein